MNHLYQLNQNVRDTRAQCSQTSNRGGADYSEPSAATGHAFEWRGLGNQAMQSLLNAKVIQAKLSVSQPNDRHEQEADRVAERVMRMPEPEAIKEFSIAGGSPPVPRMCSECEEEKLQRKPSAASSAKSASELQPLKARNEQFNPVELSDPGINSSPQLTRATLGPGQPLPQSVVGFFGSR